MTDMSAYTIRRVATSGCKLRDPEGNVVARAATEPRTFVIAALSSRVEMEGRGRYGTKRRASDQCED